jgi:hypothetical protein
MTSLPAALPALPRWSVPAGALSLLLALGTVALAFGAMAAASAIWPDDEVVAPPTVAPFGALQQARDRARLRCDNCGVVEAIERKEAVGATPASYLFVLRLADGSMRHSVSAAPGRWQVGDRMLLIGGSPQGAP